MQRLQAEAQTQFNLLTEQLQQHIQTVHTFAGAKHHSHLEEALERRRILEEYRALAQEEHASDLRTNRDRVLRHQNPLTITVDLSLTRPLRTDLPPPPRSPTDNLQQVGPLWMPPDQATILQRLRNADITPECRILLRRIDGANGHPRVCDGLWYRGFFYWYDPQRC